MLYCYKNLHAQTKVIRYMSQTDVTYKVFVDGKASLLFHSLKVIMHKQLDTMKLFYQRNPRKFTMQKCFNEVYIQGLRKIFIEKHMYRTCYIENILI